MKVTDRSSVMPTPPVARGKSTAATRRAASGVGADRVSLSPEAQRMRDAGLERVDEIKKSIADGQYTIDLDQLAAAIVQKEQL